MNALALTSLAPEVLAGRLRELAGQERDVQVEFLLHLDEFDRRRLFLEAGYESLWAYCLQVLHLREGPAGRRIAAMRVLRRFPALEAPLRDGRLGLSTVTLLGPLLTRDNLDDLVGRASYQTKAEVERLVVTLQPRVAPKEGIRRMVERQPARELLAVATIGAGSTPTPTIGAPALSAPRGEGDETQSAPATATAGAPALRAVTGRHTTELRPVSADLWSLRVTLDAEMKTDLETLASLLSHAKGSDFAAVLREAIRCGIERHGKRRGAVAPQRTRAAAARPGSELPPPGSRTAIPAQVRREVWLRDGGRCTWTGPDGHRCDSRWKLELDHVRPVARGGASTADNLRIVCKSHNLLHAEHSFGREHMARFTGAQLILG